MQIDRLETPALLIDWDIVDANIQAMAQFCRQNNVQLRPHTKTHKSPLIAWHQVRAGARGITVAKTTEAEVMVQAGFTDILVAYPVVGSGKLSRLARLRRFAPIIVAVENLAAARVLSDIGLATRQPFEVYVEVDTGLRRTGVPADERGIEFVSNVTTLPGIQYMGLMTHAGQAYGASSKKRTEIGRKEGELLVEMAKELEARGISTEEISVGSTPTARVAGAVSGVTEIRPGTYVFNDAALLQMGVCRASDCALTVLGTVISRQDGRLVVDAGSKSLSSDQPGGIRGYGRLRLLDGTLLETRLSRLSEEHGVAEISPEDDQAILPAVGDKLQIIPNHACPVVNLFDRAVLTTGADVLTELPIWGRGMVR